MTNVILQQAIENNSVEPIKLPEGAIIISNSEVDAQLTCERKHLFGFIFNKEPVKFGKSLSLGICGHEVLAVFYKAIKNGHSKEKATHAAMVHLSSLFVSGKWDVEILAQVHALVSRYIVQETISRTCDILAVEEDFYIPIDENFWYGMRLDLLVRVRTGQQKGNIMLVDHKFTYDFYSEDDLKLNPQMPKYVPAVRLAGIPVHEAYLNQIRWRFATSKLGEKSDEDLFRLSPVQITQARIRSAIRQQIIMSERIIEKRRKPLELQIIESQPVQNKMVCRSCPFKDPCIMMNEERDISGVLRTNYQDRTYGYSRINEITDGS